MKKGFTLIELLAIIVILAIILVVAVPKIMKVIDASKTNAYISNEKILVKSTELYVSKNTENLPLNIGDSTEILLSSLITDGYIKDIKSPFNKNNSCGGYVLITKVNNGLYDYSPYINCIDNTVVSSIQDKLLLHYKFDDFQEPTENLLALAGADAALERSGTGYPYYSLNITNLVKERWSTTSDKLTFQFESKRTIGGGYPVGYLYFTDWSWADSFGTGKDDWTNFSRTIALPDPSTKLTYFAMYHMTAGATGMSYSRNHQIEYKPYATPFTQSVREGIVNDYSLNNNDAPLAISTTPRWVENGKVGKGSYLFNGINNYIDVGVSKSGTSLNITNEMTIMTWVKFANVANGTRVGNIIGNYGITPHFNIEGHTDGRLRFYWNSGEIDTFISKDLRGDWHHIAVTRKSSENKLVIYIDGKDESTLGASSNIDIKWPLRIGNDFRVGTGIPFNGQIDELRIYNRSLSKDEVIQIYNSQK